MSSATSTAAVKRACDACHRRKVKCDGEATSPCKNCAASSLACTYHAIPQKKGPRGSRAKIITELRETQRITSQKTELDPPPVSPTWSKDTSTLPRELVETCATFFFQNLYPTQPILDRGNVAYAISRINEDVEAYVFLLSLCAYMCIQPNIDLPKETLHSLTAHDQSHISLGQALLKKAIRVRKILDWMETPTEWSVVTSFFLFGSYFCLDKHNLAWFHLRESTTTAHILGMHNEQHYMEIDVVESSRRRRLYWLLFVTERAYALQQHRPLTLHATIKLPSLDEAPAQSVELTGFIHLVTLFRPFDDTFVGLWNKARDGSPSSAWLAQLQQEISEALPVYLDCPESQVVDLRLSQSWLKILVWQLSIRFNALSSLAAHNAMSLRYPIEISRQVVAAATSFSQESMEIHGIGLVEKLFDIACTLTDVISCVPYEQHTFHFGPRDYLSQIVQLVCQLRGGRERYMPLLLSKISETLPNTPLPPSLLPESSSSRTSDGPVSDADSITSFNSPPLSEVSSHGMGFSSLQGLDPGDFSAPAPAHLTTSAEEYYSDMIVSPAMQTFVDPLAYP